MLQLIVHIHNNDMLEIKAGLLYHSTQTNALVGARLMCRIFQPKNTLRTA